MKSDIEKDAFELYPDHEELQDNDHEHYAMINKERIKLRDAYIKGAMRDDNEFLRRACANATADLIIERHAKKEPRNNMGKRLIERFELWIYNSGNEDHIYMLRKAIKAVKKELNQ